MVYVRTSSKSWLNLVRRCRWALLVCLTHCAAKEPALECSADGAASLYTRKIEPILKDDRPTSCNQCHLAGIDLSLFVRDTPCQTMACMAQLDLVNLTQPEASTVLSWIGRATPQSTLITADVIRAEHDGFLEWIEYSASCNSQVCPSFSDPCGKSAEPNPARCMEQTPFTTTFDDPGDCQELTMEKVFTEDVYRWRGRCSPCHFTIDTQLPAAPKWISDASDQQTTPELSCVSGSLRTMRNVLRGGYIDLTDPPKSLILQKPLSAEGGGVAHGGGPKFEGPNDPSYLSFLAFIQRYASCAAQNPSLPKPAPPPPPSSEPIAAAHGGGDHAALVTSYCDCVLRSCHDAAHAKWGLSDEALLAGCKAEAESLPPNPTGSINGNFLECRIIACTQASSDENACTSALGDGTCL